MTELKTVIDERLILDHVLTYNNSFKKEDYNRIPPVHGLANINKAGDIKFDNLSPNAMQSIFDSLIKVTLSLKGIGATMALEHNAVLRMFNSAKLLFGTSEIENISSVVGEATSMFNIITTTESFRKRQGTIAGWIPDDHKDADKTKNTGFKERVKFYKDGVSLMIPLKMIFGFCDYRKIIHQIKQVTLVLNRKSNAEIIEDIFFGTAKVKNAANVEIDPDIQISDIEWWIPTFDLNKDASDFYLNRLNDKKTIDITFMRRQATSKTFSAVKEVFQIVGITKPIRYAGIAFKSEAKDLAKNNSLFTLKHIRSVQLRINSTQLYPIQPMKFNSDVNDLAEPYQSEIEACEYFGTEPRSFDEYVLNPVLWINTSSQSDLIQGINQVFCIIEKIGNDNMEVFATVIEDAYMVYNILNGGATNV